MHYQSKFKREEALYVFMIVLHLYQCFKSALNKLWFFYSKRPPSQLEGYTHHLSLGFLKIRSRKGAIYNHFFSSWSIYEGRYFVLWLWDPLNQDARMLHLMFLLSLESSQQGWVHGLGSMTFGLAKQKFLNIEWFLHWKLN
jgi:hypothetical protein